MRTGGVRNACHGKIRGKTKRGLPILFRSVLVGFTLGLVLAVLAGAWVWLEMRMNVGLLIPAATILCSVFALWRRMRLPYSLFLMGQIFLIFSLLAIYGFDVHAIFEVPASLFREGFLWTGLTLNTAGLTVVGVLLGGNLLWIFKLK